MKDTNDTEHFQTRVINYKVRAVSEDMKFFNSVFFMINLLKVGSKRKIIVSFYQIE